MYSSIQVANYFIKKSFSTGELITPRRLQRLVYFAYGFYWAYYDQPLMTEQIQAWEFGPMEPEVFHATGRYGEYHITRMIRRANEELEIYTPYISDLGTQIFLDNVWKDCSRSSTDKLSAIGYADGGAWHKTMERNKPFRANTVIPDNLIKEQFENMIEYARKKQAERKQVAQG